MGSESVPSTPRSVVQLPSWIHSFLFFPFECLKILFYLKERSSGMMWHRFLTGKGAHGFGRIARTAHKEQS